MKPKRVKVEPPPEWACLTEREYAVMISLARGTTYAQIASLFEITADDVAAIERTAKAKLAEADDGGGCEPAGIIL